MWNLHQIMCKASRKNGALAGEKEDGPAMTPSKPVPFYTQHISIPDKDAQKETEFNDERFVEDLLLNNYICL